MSQLDPPPVRAKEDDAEQRRAAPRVALAPIYQILQPLKKTSKAALRHLRAFKPLSLGAAIEPGAGSAPPMRLSFYAFVLAPALALFIYFVFLASNQFSAEARFAVRAVEAERSEKSGDPSQPGSSGSPGFSFTASNQNAYIVVSYIRSRAIIDDIGGHVDLREIFHRPEADFWARLKKNASVDEMTRYWNSMVETSIDTLSGIVSVHVRAFRPEDALTISQAVVAQSEKLVNRISDRARRDAMANAENEVRRSFAQIQTVLAELNAFRNTQSILDPGQTSSDVNKLLMPLVMEKIKIDAQIDVMRRDLTAEAPSVRFLKSQGEALDKQISELKKKLTGGRTAASNSGALAAGASGALSAGAFGAGGSGGSDVAGASVASLLPQFEELEMKRILAERFYTMAQADLERARLRAARQDIFFSVFVPPAMPEYSNYPRRWIFSFLSFIGLAVLWGIVMMILAAVEDHRI